MCKRIVILTGAGFTRLWGGASTHEITQKVISDASPMLKEVYDTLVVEKGTDNVNFETLINELELIHQYYSRKSEYDYRKYGMNKREWKLEETCPDDALTFPLQQRIRDLIDKSVKAPFPVCMSPNDCIQIRVRDAFEKIINCVIEFVLKYTNSIENYQVVNSQLKAFFNYLRRHRIRYYTVNYDRAPLQATGISMFDGFQFKKREYAICDFARIADDDGIDCHYNLHGSIFYYAPINEESIENMFEWVQKQSPVYPYTFIPDKQDQANNPVLMSPILTGLNKPTRILFNPMSSYFNSFQRDCLKADVILTIGYSFSDVHINQAIQTALKMEKCKYVNVDLINEWNNSNSVDVGDKQWKYLIEINRSPGNSTYNLMTDSKKVSDPWIENGRRLFYWRGVTRFFEDRKAWERLFE